MTIDISYYNDSSTKSHSRNEPNIPEEYKQKYFMEENSYGRIKDSPAYIKPLIIAGTIAGVCVQDIRSKVTPGFVLQLSYVITIAGLFGMMSYLQLSEFFSNLKDENASDAKGLLTKLACLTMFCSDVFTLVAIVYMLVHNVQLTEFFNHYQKIIFGFIDYFDQEESPMYLMMLYGVYLTLAILASAGISASFWLNGNNSSIFLLNQVGDWETTKYFGVIFYLMKPITVMVAWSYVEVTLAIFCLGMEDLFQNVSKRVNQAMDKYEEQENLINFNSTFSVKLENQEKRDGVVIIGELDVDNNNVSDKKYIEANKGISTNDEIHKGKSKHEIQEVTIEDICHLTLKSMEDHYKLSDLTRRVNRIFGPLLLFDLCLYLFMITALLYGTVKGIGLQQTPIDLVLAINNISYLIRLFIIVPVCSKVHRSANEIVLTYTRVMSVCPEALKHRISLYIQQLGNSPVGISASGFFIVTLGTLLTFWGSVITYLVVLFKNASENSVDHYLLPPPNNITN